MNNLRQELLGIQKSLYKRYMRQIASTLSPPAKALSRYARDYLRFLKSYESMSSKSELMKRIHQSDLVFHGDYHTLHQSQKCVYRIVKEISLRRETILCLEMFHGSDQKWLDAYLAGRLGEDAFLKKIRYAKKWNYPWYRWKPILDLCRGRAIPVFGINREWNDPERSLRERDAYSSKIIARTVLRNPEKLVYVVDGDYHVCPEHLPREVERRLAALDVSVRKTLVFQNAGTLYWKLAREGREEADVLKIRADSYCIMNTIPTNKLQSYLNWLEYTEDAYYPVSGDWNAVPGTGPVHSVPNLVRTLCRIMRFEYPGSELQRLSVYYPSDLDFMNTLMRHPDLRRWMPQIKRKIRDNEGFLLEYPDGGRTAYLIYLANSSLAMAAEEAVHLIHAARKPSPPPRRIDRFDLFYRDAVTECLGFYGSKLLVPKRRTETLNGLRRYIGRHGKDGKRTAAGKRVRLARIVLQHDALKRRFPHKKAFTDKFDSLYRSRGGTAQNAATLLGYLLGDRLYRAVSRGRYSPERVRELFGMPLEQPGAAFRIFLALSRDLGSSNTP